MCCFGHTRFAADVFHDLHEQVIATSARGRKVLTRVQNIEAALPSLEKAVKNQKSHIHFAYVPGNYLFTSSMSKSTLIMRVHPSNLMSLLSILNSLISRLSCNLTEFTDKTQALIGTLSFKMRKITC
jgi:hypothetical protein